MDSWRKLEKEFPVFCSNCITWKIKYALYGSMAIAFGEPPISLKIYSRKIPGKNQLPKINHRLQTSQFVREKIRGNFDDVNEISDEFHLNIIFTRFS
jgi:hypothetical protein